MLYLLFFVSGAAGLVYEVAWTRSLGLVFGASHLAVATVLAVYMGGQALGGAILGGRADRTSHPLRLYGLLEIGVAISALIFLLLMKAYPSVYTQVARTSSDPVFLTAVRVGFAVIALALPTTLMGGTLSALAGVVSRDARDFSRGFSFLYAFNTFGAVTGTLAAGFFLLRSVGVTGTILIAAAASGAVGLVSLALDRNLSKQGGARAAPAPTVQAPDLDDDAKRLVLIGAGVSGFCALGYEVLWTRMLTLIVGTSVYSFTLMLTAFLVGIGVGSHLYGLLPLGRPDRPVGRGRVALFGVVQVGIGLAALAVTVAMRYLPQLSAGFQSFLFKDGQVEFSGRLVATAVLAFAFMVVPAVLMGMAFPAAASVWSAGRKDVGRAVGQVLVSNTVGAIAGPIVSGFFLIHFLGMERSLQALVIVNAFFGLAVVAAAATRRRWLPGAIAAAGVALLVARAASPGWGRAWDERYFATFQNNTRLASTQSQFEEMLRDTEILFYKEGVNETVSSVRSFGNQAFIVNGRTEASNSPIDVAVQRTLGHLPMLLHPDPKRVFVLGTGTGMTLGSTAAHPGVERIVLAEIEEAMLGVARTFTRWNHGVLDDPRLHVVFNDGRNFLATTDEKFDVITADPIHPWSGGAAYLYTVDYFRLSASRLAPGGIACQWLPIYELTPRDLASVVRSWKAAFRHVLVWMTYYDTVLIGSNDPIVVDEEAIDRRLATSPLVAADLDWIAMGTARQLLDHFLMGDEGAEAFGATGPLNTDDNLWLEFAAPASQGRTELPGINVHALSQHRESLFRYLHVPPDRREDALRRWDRETQTARIFDRAHALYLLGRPDAEILPILGEVQSRDPSFGPLKFLEGERTFRIRTEPALVAARSFPFDGTGRDALRISVVRQYLGRQWVLVSFVDNARREVYGQRYLQGEYAELDSVTAGFARQVLEEMDAAVTTARGQSADGKLGRIDVAAAVRSVAQREVGTVTPAPKG